MNDDPSCDRPWMRHNRRPTSPQHPHFVVMRRRLFFRRFTVAAVVLVLLSMCGLFALLWLAATGLGIMHGAAPVAPFVFVAAWFAGLAVIAFLRIGGRVGHPLRAVMDAADRVADGDYTVRVAERGPMPIRNLVYAFNTMTERLERNDQLRRNLMADIAHELRTPLTVIQGRVEGLVDGIYSRDDESLGVVLEETRVLSRLIEDLRTLALSQAGALKLEKEMTDVADLARDVLQAFQAQAAERQLSMAVRGGAEKIALDPVRIRQVLTNLVSNAIRHARAGGTVTIDVSSTQDRGVAVAVTDTGAGMTPDEAERVFSRFYKGAESRGSGLGLAIAQGLVLAHRGTIAIASEEGRGTTITFTLPA
jgi:signal transduction histidine kinase